MDESLRIQRLEMAADLWERVYLYHPAILRHESGIDWERAFVNAIPKIEEAVDAQDVISILNDDLLGLLDDPLSFAQPVLSLSPAAANCESLAHFRSSGYGITRKALPGREDIGLITATDPNGLRRKRFVQEMSQSLQTMGNVTSLVLDLRWSTVFEGSLSAGFLGFFVKPVFHPPPKITRLHQGWHELDWSYIYSHKWEISSPPSVGDGQFSSPTELPTLILVNNGSVLHFREALTSLQSLPNIRVVWEKTGRFSIPESKSIRCSEGIEAHLCLDAPGLSPDLIHDEPIPESALPDLLSRAFAVPAHNPNPSFPFRVSLSVPYSTGIAPSSKTATLSREERLLGLVKVRTVLKHFYPFFDRADIHPGEILPRWAPEVEAAEDLRSYYLTLERLAARLNDSHACVMHPVLQEEERSGIPVELGMREGKVVVLSALGGAGLRPGDELLEIDGLPLEGIVKKWQKRISASTEQAFFHELCRRMRLGKEGQEMVLTIRRENETRHVSLRCGIHAPTPPTQLSEGFPLPEYTRCVHRIEDSFAYMTPFEIPGTAALIESFSMVRHTDGLILDLRGYPKTHFQHELIRCLCSETVPSPRYEIPLVKDQGSKELNLKVIRYSVEPDGGNGKSVRYGKPVVALIDETTVSSAEDFCMYLRIARRVVFVGLPTAGCVGNAAFIRLPAGGHMRFTGMRVTWPDGSPFQGVGIVPDVWVQPTIRGLIEDRDEVLEQGIETLRRITVNLGFRLKPGIS